MSSSKVFRTNLENENKCWLIYAARCVTFIESYDTASSSLTLSLSLSLSLFEHEHVCVGVRVQKCENVQASLSRCSMKRKLFFIFSAMLRKKSCKVWSKKKVRGERRRQRRQQQQSARVKTLIRLILFLQQTFVLIFFKW